MHPSNISLLAIPSSSATSQRKERLGILAGLRSLAQQTAVGPTEVVEDTAIDTSGPRHLMLTPAASPMQDDVPDGIQDDSGDEDGGDYHGLGPEWGVDYGDEDPEGMPCREVINNMLG